MPPSIPPFLRSFEQSPSPSSVVPVFHPVTLRVGQTRPSGWRRGCVTLSMCSVKMTVDLLGKGAKVVKECRKRGEFSSFSSQFFSPSALARALLRTSGRSGDEFRHVRQKLGREGGQEGHETGKAITQKHRCGHVGRVSLIE